MQIINVYCSKYETQGQIWPIVHNTTVFSLILTQIIALGVFGTKKSPVTMSFTVPLLICTLLFNEYCRQRFSPIFSNFSAQVIITFYLIRYENLKLKRLKTLKIKSVVFLQDLIEKDRDDEKHGRMEEIHQMLHSIYSQFPADTINRDVHDANSRQTQQI